MTPGQIVLVLIVALLVAWDLWLLRRWLRRRFRDLEVRLNLQNQAVEILASIVDVLKQRIEALEDAADPVVGLAVTFTVEGEEQTMAELNDEQVGVVNVFGLTAKGSQRPAPQPLSLSVDIGSISPSDAVPATYTPPLGPATGTLSVSAGAFTATEPLNVSAAPVVAIGIEVTPQ